MMRVKSTYSAFLLLVVTLTLAAGCGGKKDVLPQGTTEPTSSCMTGASNRSTRITG
jgi:hypothetical protein